MAELGSGGSTPARVGAYIVGVVDHSYLATRLPLWLTLSSYASTTLAVLARKCHLILCQGLGAPCMMSISRRGTGESGGREESHQPMVWKPEKNLISSMLRSHLKHTSLSPAQSTHMQGHTHRRDKLLPQLHLDPKGDNFL
ncbi:hypothetical protein GW17_00051258 [Ensete ventricosum]|nr:hypothetical protein GW17_00051258 [Ensete ventricosum]